MKAKLLFCIICLILFAAFGTGLMAQTGISKMPEQINIDPKIDIPFYASGCTFKLKPRAKYSLTARVKSKKHYNSWSGWESMVAPYDLCLAWGDLANTLSNKINYSQTNRWCNFRYEAGFPYDTNYIYLHYANKHIITTSQNIRKAIESIKNNQLIQLEGLLVDVNGVCSDGRTYWWNTSLSRSDRGKGACELFLVTKVVISGKVYQ